MPDLNNSVFLLSTGKLYIAPGSVDEEDIKREEYFAGESDGGCKLAYECSSHEIKDEDGNVVGVLRSGERIKISGKLAGISPSSLKLITGGIFASDGVKNQNMSVLFYSELTDSDALWIFARCAPSEKGDMKFDFKRSGGVTFELASLGGCGNFRIAAAE